MDTGNHACAASLMSYASGGGIWEIIIAGAIAAAPDIVGAYGNLVKKDEYKLYNEAHSDGALIWSLIALMASISSSIVFGWWFISIGIFGYSLHLLLDKISHGEGKHWWLWSERAFLNYSLWFVLCVIALFVNPIHPWFAMMGGIWACLVAAYCQVKYN